MSAKLFFWNVRGINEPDKHRPFVSWLQCHKPLFGAILETHVKEPYLKPLLAHLCPGWSFCSNHSADPDGRIIIIWRDTVRVSVVSQSRQCITCLLTIPNSPPFYYSAVYASNLGEERADLWVELINLEATLNLDAHCWFVGGDFNQILHPNEHSGHDGSGPDTQMYQFQDCLLQAGIFDLRYLGPSHTWSNKQPSDPIAKKLDRLLVNSPSISAFPNATATFLPPLISDHAPCILDLAYTLPIAGTKPFKFPNYLTKHPNFVQLMQCAWIQAGTEFCCKVCRINWLREGDLNTTYFMRICQVRASYNAIRAFMTPSGIWITDPIEMSIHAVSHFGSVLSPSSLPCSRVYSPPDWFLDLTGFRVSAETAQLMLSVPTQSEIQAMFFRLNPNKAPGPDGLTSGFFKGAWSVVGEETTASILHFFASGFLPSTANATILSMVPKFPGATKVSDFRPISCLNTIYKVISRLLVKRLKPMLPSLILPSQTAFVKDRLLLENTNLASELINGYHRNKGKKKITIKVDIAKAFDTLSWDFLFACLTGMDLPPLFISWLRACICTPSFMVGYNGMVNGYFKGKRGLRQGDPLSPYLFVIAMNCLSFMLNKAVVANKLKFHAKCEKAKLTHLSFADDLLIFIDGSIESVQNVLMILREFENRSGLAVSLQKTSFFASGMDQEEIDTIQASTGMSHGSLPFRYLGVPLNSRKLSLANCGVLLQQIKTKFNSWSVKSLSFSGRLLLIKTVISGITTFWCSSFILPNACINKINSMCSTFLWKGDIESRNSARVAWDKVTLTQEQGGLGVKDLYIWNRSCCMRLIWMLFFRPDSVWVSWFKEVILKGSEHNYWTTKPSNSFSWLANKLLKMKNVVYPLICLRLQNGESARFWFDNWSPFGCLYDYLQGATSRLGIPLHATVSSLLRNGVWLLPPARSDNQLQLLSFLTTVNLNDDADYFEWEIQGNTTNRFSTADVYHYLCGSKATVQWASAIWAKKGIPRHDFHGWLVVLDRLPTRDRMLGWGLQVSPLCLLCNSSAESRSHLYMDCNFSYDLWCLAASRCNIQPYRSWTALLDQMMSLTSSRSSNLLTLLVWKSVMYWVWHERNQRLHVGAFRNTDSLFKTIDHQIRNRIQSFRETSPRMASLMMQQWIG
ncbi:uncharacterized protein LOC130496191 [Raphanus sativus]|uniref:Uncharacterized protein LOC130496191 n=1 Tax=Raphanus sativus TaxID=3726 RepID=A0A9W3BXI9_RAPSA|nr:uncharacterized protein LOC130496191 [Raphanus sativus]